MTAYRQEALRCATLLAANGPMSPKALRAAVDVPNAGRILLQDVYGWFERKSVGVYDLSPQGRLGIERFGAITIPAMPPVPAPPSVVRGRRSAPQSVNTADT